MTQFPTYHDPFTANIPPDVVAAIEEQCGMPIEEAVEKYGGQPILCDDGSYVAIADPPGCGREHFAAKAEAYRLLSNRQARARMVTDAGVALRLDAAPVKPTREPQTVRARPPDGLRTKAEAAAKLGCSIKTLNGHIASGALRCVVIGHGTKRLRRMINDADLDEFITNQTRKDVPCPSTSLKTAARHTGTSTSKCEVIGFTARRNAQRGAKPKR